MQRVLFQFLLYLLGKMSNCLDTKTMSEPSPKKHQSEEATPLTEFFSKEIETAKQRLSNELEQLSPKEDYFVPSKSVPTSEKHFAGHRAGFDAFMTAYSFAIYLSKRKASNKKPDGTKCIKNTEPESIIDFAELKSVKNKIVMGGRPLPLLIAKSHFTKTSSNHQLRMAELLKKSSYVTKK